MTILCRFLLFRTLIFQNLKHNLLFNFLVQIKNFQIIIKENFQDLGSIMGLKYFEKVFSYQTNFFTYFLITLMLGVSHNQHKRRHFHKIFEAVKFTKLKTIITKYKLNLEVKSHFNLLLVSGTQYATDKMGCAKGEAKQTDNQELLRILILLLRRNILPHPILNYSTYSDPFRT